MSTECSICRQNTAPNRWPIHRFLRRVLQRDKEASMPYTRHSRPCNGFSSKRCLCTSLDYVKGTRTSVHSHKPYRETHRFSACSRSRFLKSRYRLISFASSVKTTPATNKKIQQRQYSGA